MHSLHSQSASPSGSVGALAHLKNWDCLKRNQLPQSLLSFLLAAGFLLGITRCRLVVCGIRLTVCRCCCLAGRLRCRGRFLYFVYLRRSWFRRCTFCWRGINGARRFFIRVRRSCSCTYSLDSNVVAWRNAGRSEEH